MTDAFLCSVKWQINKNIFKSKLETVMPPPNLLKTAFEGGQISCCVVCHLKKIQGQFWGATVS